MQPAHIYMCNKKASRLILFVVLVLLFEKSFKIFANTFKELNYFFTIKPRTPTSAVGVIYFVSMAILKQIYKLHNHI
jgi:hypothetical protein